MTNDLGTLLPEVETAAKELGLVLFHGRTRIGTDIPMVEWDTDRRPDFHEFLNIAVTCGVKLLCIHDYKFEVDDLDEALESLKEADFSAAERRTLEKKLNALRMYVGFTCGLELAFDFNDNVYFFHLRTPWRAEFIEVIKELDSQFFDNPLEDPEEPMGGSGYFSRN